MEAHGRTLVPIQTVYLRLSEQEANVSSISDKVQEQLDSHQPIIIVDSKGQEIQDSPGTQGWFSYTENKDFFEQVFGGYKNSNVISC